MSCFSIYDAAEKGKISYKDLVLIHLSSKIVYGKGVMQLRKWFPKVKDEEFTTLKWFFFGFGLIEGED